jgi:tetratricopeptide (TPR) repeat protein
MGTWQDRSDFAAYKARGDLAMLRKDFDKAIEDYTEAIDYSNNKFIEAFLARARAYQAKGEADKAARDRERAAALRAPAK